MDVNALLSFSSIDGRQQTQRRWISRSVALSLWLNLRMAKDAVAAKERQKLAKYARLIAEKRLHIIPVAITTYGAFGPQATQFIDDAADFLLSEVRSDRSVSEATRGTPFGGHPRENGWMSRTMNAVDLQKKNLPDVLVSV